MSRLIINKNSGSKESFISISPTGSFSNPKYHDTEFSELSSGDDTLYLDKDIEQDDLDKINQFLADYDEVQPLMDDNIFINFYETVYSDLPDSYFDNNYIKNNVLDINFSQGVLIYNKFNKVNNHNYINLDRTKFNQPETFTLWIKPKSKNYQRKTILRNKVKFEVRIREETEQSEEDETDERVVE